MYGKKYNSVIIILYREISQGSVQDFTWGWGISPKKLPFKASQIYAPKNNICGCFNTKLV